MKQRPRRMALTLAAETQDALADLADATGKPASTIAAELLLEMAPQLHDAAKIIRLSRAGKKAAARRALTHMLGDGMAAIMAEQLPLPGTKGRP
jgi:hypothetical protein